MQRQQVITKEVPVEVEKVEYREVQVPVERVVDKVVEVPFDKVVFHDKVVYQDKGTAVPLLTPFTDEMSQIHELSSS